MKHALVTGGAGFIGSHLVAELVNRDVHVTLLDNLSTGSLDNLPGLQSSRAFDFIQGSVLDEALVRQLVQHADVVYHLAAAVGVDLILRQPLRSLQTNINGTEHVLRACNESSTRVLIASTSEVYGKNDKDGLAEDDDRVYGASHLSRWFYATAKSIDEAFALAYWQEYRLPVTIVRFFNTIGPRQTGRYGMVVPRFVKQALANQPVTVFGDGQQTRCFTNVFDVVRSVVELMDTPNTAGELFNVGQPDEIRIVDLARRIVQLTQSKSDIMLTPYDHPDAYGARAAAYEDVRRRVPDVSKLRHFIGYVPHTPLDTSLQQVISFHQGELARETRSNETLAPTAGVA